MNDCNHCKEVKIESSIGSIAAFEKALRIVRGNLEDGTIVESGYWPKGTLKKCDTPFNQVNGNGPFTEDIYIYYFECPKCIQIFELSCNTYHGSGGEWKPLAVVDL